MNRITKKEIKEFEKEVIQLLTSYGAIKTENYGKSDTWDGIENTYICRTDMFGKIYFCIELDASYTYTVYVRFENEEYMKQVKQFTENRDICRKYDFCEFTSSRVIVQLENFMEEIIISEDEFFRVFA